MKLITLIFLGLFLLPISVPAQFLFRDVTDSAGIYMYGSGSNEAGSGVIIADFNADGWDDFYLPGGQDSDKIFINQHDGTFTQVAPHNISTHLDRHGLQWKTYPRGGIVFDYDNDGLPDIYSVCENNDILWHNNGDYSFSDVTDAAHLQTSLDQNESMSASFGDFNGDGYNDFYVSRWYNGRCVFSGDSGTYTAGDCVGFRNWLYVNNGNSTFTERGKEFGVDCDTTKVSNIALFFDYDRDGDLDLLVGNDNGEYMQLNRVFKNMLMETGTVAFQDVTIETGLGCRISCMGIGPCDYDHDGNFDFYETTFGHDYLMHNNGSNNFVSVTESVLPPRDGFELSGPFITTGWTALMGDYDNDGWEDAFIVHGSLQPFVSIGASLNTDPNKRDTSFFYRNYLATFYDVTDKALGGKYLDTKGRGAGYLDYNHDGKLDILYGSLSVIPDPNRKVSSFRLLENITKPLENPTHWLELHLSARRTAKEAVGTIVDVWAGGVVHSRQVSTGGGFGSQNSLMQHIGLGGAKVADSIIIFWPADKNTHRQIDRYRNVKADTILYYVEQMTDDVSENKPNSNSSLKLYPFPATTVLNIITPSAHSPKHFEIFDLLGRKQMDMWSTDNTYSLPVLGLKAGYYLLRATIDGIIEEKQFIKE